MASACKAVEVPRLRLLELGVLDRLRSWRTSSCRLVTSLAMKGSDQGRRSLGRVLNRLLVLVLGMEVSSALGTLTTVQKIFLVLRGATIGVPFPCWARCAHFDDNKSLEKRPVLPKPTSLGLGAEHKQPETEWRPLPVATVCRDARRGASHDCRLMQVACQRGQER